MITTELSADVAEATKNARSDSRTVGFVPTMGFLHEGHASLIERARQECDFVVVSIFVNPTQFGKGEDLDRYPRDPESDTALCERLGVDVLFMPSVNEMYPEGSDQVTVSFPELSTKLCGKFRPGHFDGVTTIMSKLLNIVGASRCYMGKKDAQQVLILTKLVEHLCLDSEIVPSSTVRENTGLAMSSRNAYLTNDERKNATEIFRCLDIVAGDLEMGARDISGLIDQCKIDLTQVGFDVQYFSFVSQESFEVVDLIIPGKYLLCAAAVMGTTRLIDNFFIEIMGNNSVVVDRGVRSTMDDVPSPLGTEATHV